MFASGEGRAGVGWNGILRILTPIEHSKNHKFPFRFTQALTLIWCTVWTFDKNTPGNLKSVLDHEFSSCKKFWVHFYQINKKKLLNLKIVYSQALIRHCPKKIPVSVAKILIDFPDEQIENMMLNNFFLFIW